MKTELIIQCCDCGKIVGKKDGNGQSGISHTYCKNCFMEFKKSIWKIKHIAKSDKEYYHPWVSDDGRFYVFESRPYKGGQVFEKYLECKSLKEIELWVKKLNGWP